MTENKVGDAPVPSYRNALTICSQLLERCQTRRASLASSGSVSLRQRRKRKCQGKVLLAACGERRKTKRLDRGEKRKRAMEWKKDECQPWHEKENRIRSNMNATY